MSVDTTVSLAPFVEMVQPYVDLFVRTVIGASVPVAVGILVRWTGIRVDQDRVDAISKAVQTQAGIIIAKSATNLAGQSIDVRHPEVVQAANYVVATMPKVLAATGITPDKMADEVAHFIVAEIGKLQAVQPPPIPPYIGPYIAPRI